MSELRVCDTVADLVGRTPMVRLHRTLGAYPGEVLAKLEYLNPMGSVKDRIARHLLQQALRNGELRAGDVVVESSSGNTAMGMAMMAVLNDLDCRMVVRRQTSPEKLNSLRALGVDLVLVDGELPPEDPDSYNRKALQVIEETPGAYYPDQHNNRANNEAHYRTTGPEIWEQMEGRIDYFVAGIGTGGTVCGVARYLKEQDPRIRVIAVDPLGSVFHDYFRSGRPGKPGSYRLEGLGDEEIIGCPEWELIDDVIQVGDRDAFLATRDLARREAILAGGSSGAALCGVRRLIERLERAARIATLFPDSGTRYLSTIYNDDWMRRHGYLGCRTDTESSP